MFHPKVMFWRVKYTQVECQFEKFLWMKIWKKVQDFWSNNKPCLEYFTFQMPQLTLLVRPELQFLLFLPNYHFYKNKIMWLTTFKDSGQCASNFIVNVHSLVVFFVLNNTLNSKYTLINISCHFFYRKYIHIILIMAHFFEAVINNPVTSNGKQFLY